MKFLQVSAIVSNEFIFKISKILFTLWLFCSCEINAVVPSDTLRVMFYNVENLFDCHDDTLKDDTEYLEGGLKGWNGFRYRQKLVALSQVIAAVGDTRLPDLVALCEVENDSVMMDLIYRSPLFASGYSYLITNSPDERGVDVALLYQSDRFRLLASRAVSILEGMRPTRDILHVTGILPSADTLDVFVCHFPSRRGGSKQSHPFRRLAASVLQQAIDSVSSLRHDLRMIVMGDFNDALIDTSLGRSMGVATISEYIPSQTQPKSYQLFDLIHGKSPGTYAYQGKWETIDHILVSPALLDEQTGIYTHGEHARIATFPFLLENDEKYGIPIPFRTHLGGRYIGGYSDHLPVVADFVMRYR